MSVRKARLTGTRPRLGAEPAGPAIPVDALYTTLAGRPQLHTVAINTVTPDPDHARHSIDPETLTGLAQSIEQLGILQPPLVSSKHDGSYQLIAGERRWRAAQLAGHTHVDVLVHPAIDKVLSQLAENLQREDLNPIDEATAYQRLTDEHELTITELAARLGRSRSYISNTIRLLKLAPPVHEHLRQRSLSRTHALELLAEPNPDRQTDLADQAISQHWTIPQLRDALASELQPKAPAPAPHPADPFTETQTELLRQHLGPTVALKVASNGRYRLAVTFCDGDALTAFVHTLRGTPVC